MILFCKYIKHFAIIIVIIVITQLQLIMLQYYLLAGSKFLLLITQTGYGGYANSPFSYD